MASLQTSKTGKSWTFEEACTAAGLEVSVTRWWHRRRSRRKADPLESWLRKVLLRGVGPGCSQLMCWGVPQHVLTSGGHLGQYLSEDPELARRFAELRATEQASFMNYLVSKINECFDIRYHSSLYQSGLVLAPRAMSATPGPAPPAPAQHLAPSQHLAPAVPEPLEEAATPASSRSSRSGMVMVTAKTDVPQPVTPKPNRLQKVKRAMTLVMNREVSSPRAAPQRPSTVTGAERGVTSQGGTVRLADFTQPNPRRRVRPLKSSFSLWNDKKTKEVQEQTQTAQKKQSTKKAEVSLQFSSRQAMPLSVTRRESTKIVTDLAELRRIFDFYDKDGSDLIDPEEFVPLLTRVLKRPSNSMDKKEIWQIWDNIDQDGSGQISFDEFQQWYCKAFRIDGNPDRTSFISSEQVPPHEGMIRNIAKKLNLDFFKVDSLWTRYSSFDLDKSGALDYQEFTRLIQRELSPAGSPESVPDKVVQKFWIEIDTDKSGLVSFGEFCAWYMKFLFGGKSPMEQYYAAFSSRGSGPRPTLIRSETVKSSKDGK